MGCGSSGSAKGASTQARRVRQRTTLSEKQEKVLDSIESKVFVGDDD